MHRSFLLSLVALGLGATSALAQFAPGAAPSAEPGVTPYVLTETLPALIENVAIIDRTSPYAASAPEALIITSQGTGFYSGREAVPQQGQVCDLTLGHIFEKSVGFDPAILGAANCRAPQEGEADRLWMEGFQPR